MIGALFRKYHRIDEVDPAGPVVGNNDGDLLCCNDGFLKRQPGCMALCRNAVGTARRDDRVFDRDMDGADCAQGNSAAAHCPDVIKRNLRWCLPAEVFEINPPLRRAGFEPADPHLSAGSEVRDETSSAAVHAAFFDLDLAAALKIDTVRLVRRDLAVDG